MVDTVDFFKKISDYFWKQTKTNGSLICPRHRIEHTGKNVYSIIIDLELYKKTDQEQYFQRAKSRVRRTLQNLVQDPDSGARIFYPGRLNRWNMANSVIDAGACVDALSNFFLAYRDRLSENEKKEISDAIFRVSDVYLKNAAVTKEITNQRLWGATGLAMAWRIFKKDDWKRATLESVNKSLSEMWPDGTFPYHSFWRQYKIYEGIYDTTTFYQSRCIAFIYHILESLGESLDKYKEKLIRATDLLTAMYQPDGVKNINLECKRWYWLSSYEVVSNAFDVYALSKTYEITGNKIYAYYARKSLEKILRHQLLDGGIDSHLGESQNNFQCRIFWNSHLAWLARSANKIPQFSSENTKEYHYFSDSDILKFKNEYYSCILRGRKKPMNLMLGPAVGGGSLLYFGNARNKWENSLVKGEGNFIFYAKENYWKNLKRYLISNKREVKSRIYHTLVELHALNIRSFFVLLFTILKKILSSARAIYSSQWAVKVAIQKEGNKIIWQVSPAKRCGRELKGVKISREYVFEQNKLLVREQLFLEHDVGKNIKYKYIPPCNAKSFSADGGNSYSYYLD